MTESYYMKDLRKKNPRNVEELWTNLKGEREKISVDERKTLICLCSKRSQAVTENKGLHSSTKEL